MNDLEQLKLDLPLVRALAGSANLEGMAAWSDMEATHFSCELRWCVEALQELSFRVEAARKGQPPITTEAVVG